MNADAQVWNKLPGKLNPQKDVEDQLAKYLGGELPLKLDANDKTYSKVDDAALPGGPFKGKPLEITADTLMKPLAPGDYTIAITPFCSEYSVHQPGRNVAYTLAPVQGKLSGAIATLLWRGAFAGLTPQKIQSVSWAIQSGTPYGSMPPTYQAVVDQLLPEFKTQLQGNYVDQGKAAYNGFTSKASMLGTAGTMAHIPGASHLGKFPPLDTELAKMGTFGRLMLDAERQQQLITAKYTTEQLREQALFEGQGTPLPPQPAVSGAWTVKTPNAAYMRFKVGGGNLSTDNTLEIRILPQAKPVASIIPQQSISLDPQVMQVDYQISPGAITGVAETGPTLLEMLGVTVDAAAFARAMTVLGEGATALVAGEVAVPALIALALAVTAVGIIGYSQGVGAQALILTLPAGPLLAMIMAAIKKSKQQTPAPPATRKYANQICSDDVLAQEQGAMENACAAITGINCNPKKTPLAVRNAVACSVVQAKIATMQECLRLRKRVQEVCFKPPPDKGHQDQIDQLQSGIGYCYALAAVNCAPGHPMANK